MVTTMGERMSSPMPSQSRVGLSAGSRGGYRTVRTTYMFRNVAMEATVTAIRQRGEMASRIAPRAKNG